MPKYAIFSSCFSLGSFFGIRERRPFAPTIGLLTLRVDKGQNLRRARHRARKGIGSTSNPIQLCSRRSLLVLAGLPTSLFSPVSLLVLAGLPTERGS